MSQCYQNKSITTTLSYSLLKVHKGYDVSQLAYMHVAKMLKSPGCKDSEDCCNPLTQLPDTNVLWCV